MASSVWHRQPGASATHSARAFRLQRIRLGAEEVSVPQAGSDVRVLGPRDLSAVQELLTRDPITNVFVDHRVRVTRLEPQWLGGEVWGYYEGNKLTALCHAGANLVFVEASERAVAGFAEQALGGDRRCSSIVGLNEPVCQFWRVVEPSWGPARSVRPHQPFMTFTGEPLVKSSPNVRRVRPDQLDVLYPACVAMFTEEIGVSPEVGEGATLYRARVAQLISKGLAFAHIEGGEVIFKAEIPAATPHATQVQGVWVNPAYRGRGLAAPAMAAVVECAVRDLAPVVTLYVNEHNVPAYRAYQRVGFVRTADFATVLF
jgi:predicted GNAT family acetyltransferase